MDTREAAIAGTAIAGAGLLYAVEDVAHVVFGILIVLVIIKLAWPAKQDPAVPLNEWNAVPKQHCDKLVQDTMSWGFLWACIAISFLISADNDGRKAIDGEIRSLENQVAELKAERDKKIADEEEVNAALNNPKRIARYTSVNGQCFYYNPFNQYLGQGKCSTGEIKP